MSNPLRGHDKGCDARTVYVPYCSLHGFTCTNKAGTPDVFLHKSDSDEEAANHNVPDRCSCFREGEYYPAACDIAAHRQAS